MFYAADILPQLTLWVGTAGGALGVFTVTRSSVGKPLELAAGVCTFVSL